MSERLTFLRAWMANPLRVAALAPSSRSLAALAASEVTPGDGPVIELGAGTGPVTQALLDRGVREDDLVLVESDPVLAETLRRRFPRVRTLSADAGTLDRVELFGGRKAAAIVSGVPVLTMPRASVTAVLGATFAHLAPGGSFYQYSYSLRCPVPRSVLDPLGLVAERVGITFGNVPPALVYRISRRAEVAIAA